MYLSRRKPVAHVTNFLVKLAVDEAGLTKGVCGVLTIQKTSHTFPSKEARTRVRAAKPTRTAVSGYSAC
jgi:hypothetical protein